MNNSIQYLVRENIQNLAAYSSAREEYAGSEGIFLDANENPFGEYNRYPDPYQLALKAQLGRLKNIDPKQIFLGNGSDEIIDLTFRIFCEPAVNRALTFSPTYGMYKVSANINNVELLEVPLDESFQIDKATLESCMADDKLKLILICTPNNPTGNLLRVDDIEFILERFQGIVLIDEAYIDFCSQASFVEKLADYPNLIVIQTLSKAWGLAGLRLGVAYMNQEMLAYYNKVKAPYNISVLNQQAALAALSDEVKYGEELKTILGEKEKLIQALQQIKIIRKIYPSDTNFLLVSVEDADAVYERLVNEKIIIRNRNQVVRNCVRITVGTPEQNQQLITALKNISNA